MKKFLILYILCACSCFQACAQFGGGVKNTNTPPTVPPQYPLKPSLIEFDTTEQALWVNNQRYGWFKLMSPEERYVRGMVNVNFADDQFLNWSVIDGFIRTQAGGNSVVLNGLYIVKFTSNVGNPITYATIENITVGVPTALVTNNDFWVCRYYRNTLLSITRYDDKTQFHFQNIRDTLSRHTNLIDSLYAAGPSVPAWLLGGNNNTQAEKFGTKTNQRIDIVTRDSVRGVVKEDGKFGFGVTEPTQTVDVLDMRNRGTYRDMNNSAGVNSMALKSYNGKTRWEYVYSSLHFTHTPIDSFVALGKGSDFLAVNYRGGLPMVYVVLRFFEEQTTGSVTGVLKKKNASVPATITTLGTVTFTAPNPMAIMTTATPLASGDIVYFEVTNITGTPPKGLSIAFDYKID